MKPYNRDATQRDSDWQTHDMINLAAVMTLSSEYLLKTNLSLSKVEQRKATGKVHDNIQFTIILKVYQQHFRDAAIFLDKTKSDQEILA